MNDAEGEAAMLENFWNGKWRKPTLWGLGILILMTTAAAVIIGPAFGIEEIEDTGDVEGWQLFNEGNSGIIGSFAMAIAFDGSGRAWIGTSKGVSVYDGESWLSYTPESSDLVGNWVNAIEIDQEGRIWIALAGGVNGSVGGLNSTYEGEWNSYIQNHVSVHDITFDESNRPWIATGDDVEVFDGTSWTSHFLDEIYVARAIAIDGSGRVWIGSINGLHVYDEGTWISYTEDNSNILENPINCITFDHGGNVWVGHPGGASVFDGETWINYPWEHGFPNFPETYPDDVQAITVDSEGRILFASASALRIFDGDVWLEYNSRNSGYVGGAYDIAIDPEGDIWIASSWGILVASVDSSGLPQLVSQKRVATASYLSWSFLSTPIAIMTLLWLAIFLKDIVLLIVGAIAGLGWVIAVPNPVPKGDFYVGPLYGWQPIVGGIIGSIVRKLRKTTSVIPTIIGMVVGGALSCLLWIRLILYAIMI